MARPKGTTKQDAKRQRIQFRVTDDEMKTLKGQSDDVNSYARKVVLDEANRVADQKG